MPFSCILTSFLGQFFRLAAQGVLNEIVQPLIEHGFNTDLMRKPPIFAEKRASKNVIFKIMAMMAKYSLKWLGIRGFEPQRRGELTTKAPRHQGGI